MIPKNLILLHVEMVILMILSALQVEQLGHPFFLFRDKETNEVQVIYKRQTHGYGLIIPSNEA